MSGIIGIDPGLTGAIACYNSHPKANDLLRDVVDLPITKLVISRKTIKNIDIPKLRLILNDMVRAWNVTDIVIEKVQASPQMGVSSAFKFGQTFGILQGLAEATGCTVHLISPQKWKARLILSGDKKKSVEKARTIFKGSHWYCKDSKDGQAEAALLAFYGAHHLIKHIDPLS